MKKVFWVLWLLLTVGLASYYGYMMWYGSDKSQLLIGETSYGHYQIEMACSTCHTSPFGGPEVLQNACVQCHGEELDAVNDSHPKSKFTDPRNADLLKVIDARYCISCHTEHHKDKTRAMGLTLPEDYCFHCHQDVRKNRESHKDLGFDTCASAGCHNYHDNLALYEGFLVKHANEPMFNAIAKIPPRTAVQRYQEKYPDAQAVTIVDIDVSQYQGDLDDALMHEWLESAHGRNGIECKDCHLDKKSPNAWIQKPSHQQCESCHQQQVKGFLEGKHGMRLAAAVSQPLPAISPGESELPFKSDALNRQHSCSSCHSDHTFDTKLAAVDACLACHNDKHSTAFLSSPHFVLWQKELSGELPENTGVSCATCHMPRIEKGKDGSNNFVSHNQNLTLRPNEKMIRPVCMHCHGLGFSIDALADKQLIETNFNGRPIHHIPSIDMVLEREKSK